MVFLRFFLLMCIVNLQHSGLDVLAPLCLCLALSVSILIMSMSLSMDVSAETGAAGSGSLDHLNDPDKRNRLATGSLCNLQQEIFAYRSGKDMKRLQGLCAQLWPVHICCSERQSWLGVSCLFV